jgi:hypothetical protein
MFTSFKVCPGDRHCIRTIRPVVAFRVGTPVVVSFCWVERSVSEGMPTFEATSDGVHNHSSSWQSEQKCRWFLSTHPAGFTFSDPHFRHTNFLPHSSHRFSFHFSILLLIHSIMLIQVHFPYNNQTCFFVCSNVLNLLTTMS